MSQRMKPRCLISTDLPELMADSGFLTLTRPLSQFIADWNTWHFMREEMIAAKPECEMFYLARIAAIIHALCDRDKVPVPDWVWEEKLPEPEIIVPRISSDSDWGALIISEAPQVCEYHNLYFQPDMLRKFQRTVSS